MGKGGKSMLKFNNASDVARTMAKVMSDKFHRYTARPWNRYIPENTMWLLIPNTDWPAYRYGKYSFWADEDHIWCGLYVEKGLSPKLSGLYKFKIIMNDDWVWNKFVKSMYLGELDNSINALIKQINKPIHFFIEGSFVDDIQVFDPEKDERDIKFHFIIDEKGTRVVEKNKNRFVVDGLNNLEKISMISEVPDILAQNKEIDWMWFDFYVMVSFLKQSDSNYNSYIIDEFDLCKKLLEPLEKWIK